MDEGVTFAKAHRGTKRGRGGGRGGGGRGGGGRGNAKNRETAALAKLDGNDDRYTEPRVNDSHGKQSMSDLLAQGGFPFSVPLCALQSSAVSQWFGRWDRSLGAWGDRLQ